MYHVVFMYPTNITVVSKNETDKIVYNRSFDRTKPLCGIDLDSRNHTLITHIFSEKIYTTGLKGEDVNAWKLYEKQGKYD